MTLVPRGIATGAYSEPLDALLTHSQDFNSLDELRQERVDEMFAPAPRPVVGADLGRGEWEAWGVPSASCVGLPRPAPL